MVGPMRSVTSIPLFLSIHSLIELNRGGECFDEGIGLFTETPTPCGVCCSVLGRFTAASGRLVFTITHNKLRIHLNFDAVYQTLLLNTPRGFVAQNNNLLTASGLHSYHARLFNVNG